MVDPGGIANWSVTHVDWSEEKWHPKAYRAQDVTFELLKNITVWFITPPFVCLFLSFFLIKCHIVVYSLSNLLSLFFWYWCYWQSIDESYHKTSDESVSWATYFHIFSTYFLTSPALNYFVVLSPQCDILQLGSYSLLKEKIHLDWMTALQCRQCAVNLDTFSVRSLDAILYWH